jgi:hypothetical protein
LKIFTTFSNFKNSVNDYIQTCEDLNRKPQKTYKGSFNLRIDPKNLILEPAPSIFSNPKLINKVSNSSKVNVFEIGFLKNLSNL